MSRPAGSTATGGPTGVPLALVSAATFALSGSFATSLFNTGWTPGAAVTVRIGTAAVVVAVPALVAARGKWHEIRHSWGSMLLFGLLAVAGAQLFFFNAVQTLSVGVALMLEYMGLVLVVLWQWVFAGHRPSRMTVVGILLAVLGLTLVLDLFGATDVDPVGILWGLGAAVGLATYYVVAGSGIRNVPPITMTGAGMAVGGSVLGVAGLLGVLPMATSAVDVELAGRTFPWFVAVAGLGLVTGALAYTSGVIAAGRLGAKLSAFIGLTEVLFAVLFAWILLDQLPEVTQLVGGLFIVAGIGVVRREELSKAG